MSKNVLRICVLAAGIALFVVLSLCLQVPVFEIRQMLSVEEAY